MQQVTFCFTDNIERLRVQPMALVHASLQKFDGDDGNSVLESSAALERVFSPLCLDARHQQTTLPTTSNRNTPNSHDKTVR